MNVNPPKQGPNSNQNKGHLGSRYIIIYIFITFLGATQVVIFSLPCELASIYVKLEIEKKKRCSPSFTETFQTNDPQNVSQSGHGCQERLVGPAPASNLEEFLREVPKTSPNVAWICLDQCC